MSKVGWGWMVALLVGLMAGCLVGCSTSASKADEADSTALSKAVDSSLPTITAQVVGQRSFNTQSTATGILRAPAQSKLNFRTGGTLTQIVIQNGASVKAGQLLAQLDERDGQMALRVAQDGLLDARTQRNALLAEYGHDNGDTAHVKPNAHRLIDGQCLWFRWAQVLLCCSYGYTMKQTAEKLSMAYKTVDTNCTHLRTLFKVKGHHTLHRVGIKLQPELEQWLGTGLKPAENDENTGTFPIAGRKKEVDLCGVQTL